MRDLFNIVDTVTVLKDPDADESERYVVATADGEALRGRRPSDVIEQYAEHRREREDEFLAANR